MPEETTVRDTPMKHQLAFNEDRIWICVWIWPFLTAVFFGSGMDQAVVMTVVGAGLLGLLLHGGYHWVLLKEAQFKEAQRRAQIEEEREAQAAATKRK